MLQSVHTLATKKDKKNDETTVKKLNACKLLHTAPLSKRSEEDFFDHCRKFALLPFTVNQGICLKKVTDPFLHTNIDFSECPVSQSMYQQQCPAVCTLLLYSNKLIICFRLQQFSLTKPESQRNLTLFKWLLKHDCCPWILMAIFPNVQTREGEISKLLTPQRISSGHNMS